MKVRVALDGGRELERKLRRLPDAIRGKKLEKSVLEGSEVLVDYMKALAPRGENNPHAYEFIAANLRRDARRETVSVDVGPRGAGFYLTFHETGTLHMAPSPFMRPAAEAAESEVVDAVRDRLFREVSLIARRR